MIIFNYRLFNALDNFKKIYTHLFSDKIIEEKRFSNFKGNEEIKYRVSNKKIRVNQKCTIVTLYGE